MILDGRVAIVTGGARGIGRAIAEAFGDEGAKLALWDNRPAVCETARELTMGGLDTEAFVVDVRDSRAIDHTVTAVLERFEQIDVLVNNAGMAILEPSEGVSDAHW